MINVPNQLTIARCALTAVFVVLMSFDHAVCYTVAYAVFTVAALTDYYDGKIARRDNLITNFGKLMDPVADKILMVAAFVMLMHVPQLHVPGWTVVAILAREFLITGARSLAAADGVVLAANAFGKAKTALQMTYVFVFLALAILFRAAAPWMGDPLRETLGGWLSGLSLAGMVVVALYTLYSGAQFGWVNWKALKLHDLS
ncbi:MAG: CDP-diacylglycerol--glycerol-3-phosphate 3-phosphatidyltransferase [Candidatus Hydrogenedentes bacterium]|nr:CDP-diacylglycerol--glycerol-3-phosphate 3-phosphatidyltransferase [Candidatus Hydrogenedentota bacterium]